MSIMRVRHAEVKARTMAGTFGVPKRHAASAIFLLRHAEVGAAR